VGAAPVAREDLAAARAPDRDVRASSSSGRLARPSYQLDVLDSFVGEEQQRRRREAPGSPCASWPPPAGGTTS
jgi:hypothetical protein